MFGPQIEMVECQTLYNMLNEGIEYAKISDLYFLYLLGKIFKVLIALNLFMVIYLILTEKDCRQRADYNEGHILCAKNIKRVINLNVYIYI